MPKCRIGNENRQGRFYKNFSREPFQKNLLFFHSPPPFPQKSTHFPPVSEQPMTADKTAKETEKERFTMASKNSNQINVPQAREAMDKFKMQAAQDVDGPVTY